MTRLYLVRHGQTAWNTELRMQGHLDSPLTELGLRQAEALAAALADLRLDALYTSSAGRAVTTADQIAQIQTAAGRPLAPRQRDDLREIHLGAWEGKTKAEIHALYGDRALAFWQAPDRFVPLDGEGYPAASDRLWSAIQAIVAGHSDQSVAVVSHGVAIQLILARAQNLPLAELWTRKVVHQASLSCLTFSPAVAVEFVDRRDHLVGLTQNSGQVV